jgi:hypothetical protein
MKNMRIILVVVLLGIGFCFAPYLEARKGGQSGSCSTAMTKDSIRKVRKLLKWMKDSLNQKNSYGSILFSNSFSRNMTEMDDFFADVDSAQGTSMLFDVQTEADFTNPSGQ